MKKFILLLVSASMLLSLAACSGEGGGEPTGEPSDAPTADTPSDTPTEVPTGGAGGWEEDPDFGLPTDVAIPDGVSIELSDSGVTVDGEPLSEDRTDIYTANDIVYYEAGHDFTYGEGTAADEHTADEAAAHTVLHIAAPGAYVISGKLSAGQIAVDLGEDAEDDPEAVVNLVLSGLDITCTVAPAIIFYNVYECGDKDNAQSQVDTSEAGANVYIADGTVNTVNGSYVARIYKSVELSEDGKTVLDSKKLHKYDGALYSKMSMNVLGNDGVLNINAENEGLDSELHLTIGGGVINIVSGNDGINTNEDGVSVTTVNAGQLTVTVNGSTGEGDGIDSNGWLVINGGRVRAYACATSGDAGIDSDMGILINGGEVVATGNMLDAIDTGSTQNYVLFNVRNAQAVTYTLKDADGSPLLSVPTVNAFSILIVSSPEIDTGLYALYNGETLVASAEPGAGNMGGFGPGGMGGHGGMGGQGGMGGDRQPPEGGTRPEGQFPGGQGGQQPPEMPTDGEQPPEMPSDGQQPPEMPSEGETFGEPLSDSAIVNVTDYIPGILVDLRYATENNFTGRTIYDFTEASLRYGTVKKLREAQEELSEKGYALKIWDALRPVSAQFDLWAVCPDNRYVADPRNGYSNHSRGNTVDLTMVLSDGSAIPMPSDFDDFTPAGDRNYSDVPADAAQNARLLEETMRQHGFVPYAGEWWHYTDEDSYGVLL